MKYLYILLIIALASCKEQHPYFRASEFYQTDTSYTWTMLLPEKKGDTPNFFIDHSISTIGMTTNNDWRNSYTYSPEGIMAIYAPRMDSIYDLKITSMGQVIYNEQKLKDTSCYAFYLWSMQIPDITLHR